MAMGHRFHSGENRSIGLARTELDLFPPQGLPLKDEIHDAIREKMLIHLLTSHIKRSLDSGTVSVEVLEFPSSYYVGADVGLNFYRDFKRFVQERLSALGFEQEREVFASKEATPVALGSEVCTDASCKFSTPPNDMERRAGFTEKEMLEAIPDHVGHGVSGYIFTGAFINFSRAALTAICKSKSLDAKETLELSQLFSAFTDNPKKEHLEGPRGALLKRAFVRAAKRLRDLSVPAQEDQLENRVSELPDKLQELFTDPSEEKVRELQDIFQLETMRQSMRMEGDSDRAAAGNLWERYNAFWENPSAETLGEAYFDTVSRGDWTTNLGQLEAAHRGRLLLSLFEWGDVMKEMKFIYHPRYDKHKYEAAGLTEDQVREMNAKQFGFLLQTVAELTPYMEMESAAA